MSQKLKDKTVCGKKNICTNNKSKIGKKKEKTDRKYNKTNNRKSSLFLFCLSSFFLIAFISFPTLSALFLFVFQAPSNIVGDSISSSPKDDGLEHRTVTLRFQIDRKYTQGNFIRLRCVSTVFGIPVSPQTVIRNVAVKAQPTTQVNNEKLHWPDVSSNKPKLQINSSLLCYCYCTVIAYFSFRIRAEL